ncbi:hypothetical protein ACHAPT_010566 [Fusarium lateritium]
MEGITGSAAFGAGESTQYVSPSEAAERINPTIAPKDDDWTSTLNTFTELYESEKPVQQILSEHFTHHEARMLIASDRPDIKNLQYANTERYNALLRGRFQGVERNVVSKLTMLYFGLPVEPMNSPLDELINDLGINEPMVPLYHVQPPLHFLTAHNARNWGKENMRGQEAPCYPIPIPSSNAPTHQNRPVPRNEPVLSLRGGEASDSEDDSSSQGSPTRIRLALETLSPPDYVPPHETPALPQDEWIYLYGLTGCVPFVPRKWRSYSKALRQVLHLDHDHPRLASDPPFNYVLVHFDRKTKKSRTIHDKLKLAEDSPAMKYLRDHFTGVTTSDHADCCAFFVTKEGVAPPLHWEPQKEQFATDLAKIGRQIFDVKTSPGKDAISYAYLAFPKTKTATFTIDEFGSNQFNANFRAAMDILFGRPENHDYHHALFRLLDKSKPKTTILPPIVFGAMGQMQWVWETLHPLNNPDAHWIVDWMSMDETATTPVIVPGYYPDPHTRLLSTEVCAGMSPLKDAFDVIQDAVTEAFNKETLERMDSIIVRLGNGGRSNGKLAGFKIPVNRPYRLEERLQLGKELEALVESTPYLLILPVWSAGESKMFPSWTSKVNMHTDFPSPTSRLSALFKSVDALCVATGHNRDWRRGGGAILLKSMPPWDSLETPKTDFPAFIITPFTTQSEWLTMRASITSCDVSVSLLKPAEADWWRSIAKSNIWGVRPETGSSCTWLFDVHDTWSKEDPVIKRVDGSKSLPIPRTLKKEAGVAADKLPFVKAASVQVDGRKGKVKGTTKQRKSAFNSRKQSSLNFPPQSPIIAPGTLALPVTMTLRGPDRRKTQAEGSSGPAKQAKQQTRNQSKPEVIQPISETAEVAEETEDAEEPMDTEPTESQDQGRLAPDDDLWGEDDESMPDADNDVADENESSEEEERYPQTKFESESEYGDDLASISSGPSDAPVAFPDKTTRPKATEAIDKDDRARTWATQPGIFEGWDPKAWPSLNGLGIPITAAPAEQVLRTGNSVPMVTKAILTPSEQVELQNSFHTVRSIALKRTMQCPFKGCDFSHRLDQPEVIEKHTKLVHQANKCMWCDEPLFEWWDPEQRMAHLRKNHEGKLVRALGIKSAAGDKAKAVPGTAAPRPDKQQQPVRHQFAPRNGPRAPVADMMGTVTMQDGVFQPAFTTTTRGAIPDRILQLSSELLSLVCGGSVFQPIGASPDRVVQIINELYGLVQGANMTVPYGAAMGLPQLSPGDISKTVKELLEKYAAEKAQASQRKPRTAADLTAAEQQKLLDSLRPARFSQPPRMITFPLDWHDMPGPLAHDDPPIRCPIPNCSDNNFEYYKSREVWEHFQKKHARDLESCPFCQLPFVYSAGEDKSGEKIRKRRPAEECIKHFDCHIWQLWDLAAPRQGKYSKYNWPQVEFPSVPLGDPRAELGESSATRPREAARPQEDRPAETTTQQEQEAVDTSKQNQKCAFFEKCGAMVGSMTDRQYRHHMRVNHPKEVKMVDFDSEEEEEDAPSPRTRTPAPTPRPDAQPEAGDTEVVNISTDESNQPSTSTAKSGTSRKRKRTRKPRSLAASHESDDELSGAASDARSTRSRGRTHKKMTSIELRSLDEGDAYAPASESRSSATQGREPPAKKARRERPLRDDDGEYEDDGASTDDEPEEGPEVAKRLRRARSPDWVKRLGPGDPDFEPSDDMYCSKCLRKAPKSGNKSPNRSPLSREKELEFHSDLNRCCRIRNGEGVPQNLPNRSGWIRAANLPGKLGQIKSKFTLKYPAYDRTVYPTKAADNNASVWRSDPNNEDNEAFWNMPWPPYEGQPPFPGSWEDPGIPREDTVRRKQRESWLGRAEDDPNYKYQSDTDSDDDLKPDVDDIAELQEEAEASNDNSSVSGLKKRRTGEAFNTPVESGADTEAEDDGPATKKLKKSPAAKPKKAKRKPKRPRGKTSSQPSRASSRVRQKKSKQRPEAPSGAE